jgi:hypothetical protein
MKLTKRGKTVLNTFYAIMFFLTIGFCGSLEYSDAVALAKYDAKNQSQALLIKTQATPPVRISLRSYARLEGIKRGWSSKQHACLVKLWNQESGWNPRAHNSSSGAHGIPQALPASKMRSAGADYYTNGKTQIRWGIRYIQGRYGNPCSALNFHNRHGWY